MSLDTTPRTNAPAEGSLDSAQPDALDGDQLPVTLRFEAGDVRLPFAEVGSVAPGFVFELDKPLDERLITVYANDVAVATGELVTVGDIVGVQITTLLRVVNT